MKITLQQIQKYSECPRQLHYKQSLEKELYPKVVDPFKVLVKDIIKQSYSSYIKNKSYLSWITIKNRIDKICFKSTNIDDSDQFDKAYKQSIKLINGLYKWYYSYYIKSPPALVNVDLSIPIGNSVINHRLDLLFIKEDRLVPLIFDDTMLSIPYNRLEYKALLWLIYKETQQFPKVTEFIQIREQSIKSLSMHNSLDIIDKLERYILHIVQGIEKSIFYPSINSQCNECEFKTICTI